MRHLVHPISGKLRVYDIYGMAKCPDCGALWRRRRNESTLVE